MPNFEVVLTVIGAAAGIAILLIMATAPLLADLPERRRRERSLRRWWPWLPSVARPTPLRPPAA